MDTDGIARSLVSLVLFVDVPGVDGLALQVAYWQQPPMGHAVQRTWTDSDGLLEDQRYDQDGLAVFGVDGEPVERLDWMIGKTLVVRRLRLADTGTLVSRKGAGWWTAMRRAPTAVTRLRPPAI